MRGVLEDRFEKGEYRLTKALELFDVSYPDESFFEPSDPELRSFININTPEDLDRAKRLLKQDMDSVID